SEHGQRQVAKYKWCPRSPEKSYQDATVIEHRKSKYDAKATHHRIQTFELLGVMVLARVQQDGTAQHKGIVLKFPRLFIFIRRNRDSEPLLNPFEKNAAEGFTKTSVVGVQ